MSKEADIEKALRVAYLAGLDPTGENTAFENEAFQPKGKAIWYSFHFMPNTPTVATLGDVGTDNYTGLLQIDINTELGKGKGGISDAVEILRLAFTPTKRLVYGSANIIIKSCGQSGSGKKMGGSFRTFVSILYEVRLGRATIDSFNKSFNNSFL